MKFFKDICFGVCFPSDSEEHTVTNGVVSEIRLKNRLILVVFSVAIFLTLCRLEVGNCDQASLR